jgi:peptide subunit release factor 1 (eRF1)
VEAITEDTVRRLAGFRGDGSPVTSCYLDVDGRRYVRPRDYELQLDRLIRQARDAGSLRSSVEADLARIERFVRQGFDRSRTRGVAVFSSSERELWYPIELPVPVRNQLAVNESPQVRELERVIDEYEHFAVLLADRQRARLLVFHLGALVDKSERFDRLPRHDDDHGDWDRDHVRDHSAALAQQHLRRTAQVAFELYRDAGFDHLIVGAPEEIAGDLERELHSYLRERIAGRIAVPVNARDDEIRAAALEIEEQVERAKEAAAVERLRNAVGAGNGGVAGLDRVLHALVERRVATLLVSEEFRAPGWRCRACGYVAVKGRGCPVCGRGMDQVDDIVEEAVEEALNQSCRVEICRDNADLDVLGRIGALLRF